MPSYSSVDWTEDGTGNQAGGWTLTWQGGSTTNIPGTSILSGIRSVATHGTVTYSLDAGGGKEFQ